MRWICDGESNITPLGAVFQTSSVGFWLWQVVQREVGAREAFDWGLGVCQDQAHVMVAVCRSIDLPARYVSGYFYAANEPDLASHAWVDVCVDPANRRWLSLDVTHRCPTDERHIRLAAATDYSACTPVKGLRRGGGEEDMSVGVRISLA